VRHGRRRQHETRIVRIGNRYEHERERLACAAPATKQLRELHVQLMEVSHAGRGVHKRSLVLQAFQFGGKPFR
jgi:hypothetical protein